MDEVKRAIIINQQRKIILNQNSKLSLTESINKDDTQEWINIDEKLEIADEIIVNAVNNENESSDDGNDNEIRRMKVSHTDGLKAIESVIEYIKQ